MDMTTEKFILMQLIKDSEWVPDEAQHVKWPKRVLYNVGPIPVYEFKMPGTEEHTVDQDSADKQKNPVDNKDIQNPVQKAGTSSNLTPNQDNIDYRLKTNLTTAPSGVNGVLSLLHSLIDTCVRSPDETIDLNNFWEYAEN